jgi:hypothetical protein
VRAIRYHHQLCDSPTLLEADFDGDHGKHGAMAVASPDERSTANALVTTRALLMLKVRCAVTNGTLEQDHAISEKSAHRPHWRAA